ncbi:hypothetical protein, partial [uncultured Lamprocystis sp.]|uniref:hypothetical protein n=1 Tax=uncultured Lamprocystis sp. TaxID=543132 RepID=UPI0025E802D1
PVGAVRGDLQPPRRPPTQRAGRIGTARGGLVMDADAGSGVAILLDLVMVATFEALSALSVGIFNRRGDHQPSGPDASALPVGAW